MNQILDSGTRRSFESGAVRDIAEGKGRMDLLPLDIIANLYGYFNLHKEYEVPSCHPSLVFRQMHQFMNDGNTAF